MTAAEASPVNTSITKILLDQLMSYLNLRYSSARYKTQRPELSLTTTIL